MFQPHHLVGICVSFFQAPPFCLKLSNKNPSFKQVKNLGEVVFPGEPFNPLERVEVFGEVSP